MSYVCGDCHSSSAKSFHFLAGNIESVWIAGQEPDICAFFGELTYRGSSHSRSRACDYDHFSFIVHLTLDWLRLLSGRQPTLPAAKWM